VRIELSVSPNGSYWLKLDEFYLVRDEQPPFSIPERIVLVETALESRLPSQHPAFSIPERIVLVETLCRDEG